MTRVTVDDRGILLSGQVEGTLDVRLGEHRAWSFTTADDGRRVGRGVLVAWPDPLRTRLVGRAAVLVVPHTGGEPLFAAEVTFGGSEEELSLLDEGGQPLSLDKAGHLTRTFDQMGDGARQETVDAARKVLDDLVEIGLDAYLCYGGLLGARRNGHMIGHDSDVDLAWLSPHEHPFDIIRESRAAEKALAARGWQVVRMSSANFKVWVPLSIGKRVGVDVFGSFYIGTDELHIMGNLIDRLPRDAVVPFSTIELEGVEFPAPRDVNRFLAYTYGPSWRVPDPAFRFEHSDTQINRMSALFRGSRTHLHHWTGFYDSHEVERVPTSPTDFVQWAAARIPDGSRVLELGSGLGRDAFWLSDQGYDVTGSEYCWSGRRRALARMRARMSKGLPRTRFPAVNLENTTSSLVTAASWLRLPGPTHVFGRLLIDALEPSARRSLWRFASTIGRSGGHTFLEFRTAESAQEPTFFPHHPRTYADPAEVVAEIEAWGGTVVARDEGRDRAKLGRENPVVCRLEIAWPSRRATTPPRQPTKEDQ